MYISIESNDGRLGEFTDAKDYYIDNSESGTSLLIVKINKEDTVFYNMDQVRSFFVRKS